MLNFSILGGIAQLARAFGSYPKCRRFESVYQLQIKYGRIPEWPKGADCKSVASCFDGSNPSSPTKIPSQKWRDFLKDMGH